MDNLLYSPHYRNTDDIVNLTAEISALADVLTVRDGISPNPKLRRINRIMSVRSSLAIEQNSLSVEQVTAVLDGKRVAGSKSEITEAVNAFKAYDKLPELDPFDIDDLELAHKILMTDLLPAPGRFRTTAIAVVRGAAEMAEAVHIAPKADMVSGLVADLLLWTKKAKAHPLIKSCVFHYEFEFIHPFADGNGRMGRMWQTLLLSKWKPIFAWLPVETIIKEHQSTYYNVLEHSNDSEDCTEFIEFMLKSILEALQKYGEPKDDQVKALLASIPDEPGDAGDAGGRWGKGRR